MARPAWHRRWMVKDGWTLHEFAMICCNLNPEKPLPRGRQADYDDAVKKIEEGVRSGELPLDLESMEVKNCG